MIMKKPESEAEETGSETEETQRPAQGDQADDNHALNVEAEAQAHGLSGSITWDMRPGANQGGNENA